MSGLSRTLGGICLSGTSGWDVWTLRALLRAGGRPLGAGGEFPRTLGELHRTARSCSAGTNCLLTSTLGQRRSVGTDCGQSRAPGHLAGTLGRDIRAEGLTLWTGSPLHRTGSGGDDIGAISDLTRASGGLARTNGLLLRTLRRHLGTLCKLRPLRTNSRLLHTPRDLGGTTGRFLRAHGRGSYATGGTEGRSSGTNGLQFRALGIGDRTGSRNVGTARDLVCIWTLRDGQRAAGWLLRAEGLTLWALRAPRGTLGGNLRALSGTARALGGDSRTLRGKILRTHRLLVRTVRSLNGTLGGSINSRTGRGDPWTPCGLDGTDRLCRDIGRTNRRFGWTIRRFPRAIGGLFRTLGREVGAGGQFGNALGQSGRTPGRSCGADGRNVVRALSGRGHDRTNRGLSQRTQRNILRTLGANLRAEGSSTRTHGLLGMTLGRLPRTLGGLHRAEGGPGVGHTLGGLKRAARWGAGALRADLHTGGGPGRTGGHVRVHRAVRSEQNTLGRPSRTGRLLRGASREGERKDRMLGGEFRLHDPHQGISAIGVGQLNVELVGAFVVILREVRKRDPDMLPVGIRAIDWFQKFWIIESFFFCFEDDADSGSGIQSFDLDGGHDFPVRFL